MSTTSEPTSMSRSPTPRAPPFWTTYFGQYTTAEPQPTSESTYTENPNTTQWTITTQTPTRTPSTITSMRPSSETEGTITTSSSELYPSTSTSEIISPTTSFNSTTTDSITPITSSTTTEPYPPSSSTTRVTITTSPPPPPPTTTTATTTTTTTTTSSSTTTTTWSYTRSTTTTSVAPTILPPPPPSNDSGSLSTGAIVGIAVASVVCILALALSGLFIRRRQQHSRQRDPMYYQNPLAMHETRHNNHSGGGGEGGPVNNNNNNNGTGLGISSVNDPYSENDFRRSQDQMNAASLDTGGGFSSQSSGFGYDNVGTATVLGAGLYGGYDDDYRYQQHALHQQLSRQPFYPSSNNQTLSYTPPTEPDIAPEDRYDPTYASRREQEAAYMNYQQQQLYLQSQQQLQQQQQQRELIQQHRQQKQHQHLAGELPVLAPVVPPPPLPLPTTTTESFDTRPTVIGGGGGQEGYHPENRFSVNSQTYLERLRGSYPPATIDQSLTRDSADYSGAGSVVMNSVRTPSPGLTPPLPPPIPVPVPPISSSHVGAGTPAGREAGSEDYAYPESDARRVPDNDRWSSPPSRPTWSTTDTPAVTVQADDQPVAASTTTEGDITSPPMVNRFAGGGGGVTTEDINSNVVSPRRSSVLSQASVSTASSGLNHKRLHSPQPIPSPKRAPQARHPEEEPTITTITREPL